MATSGEQTVSGVGAVSVVTAVGNPAAGADWAFVTTKPSALLAVVALFVASAAVANREPVLEMHDAGGHTFLFAPSSAVTVAGTSTIYSWGVGAATTGAIDAISSTPIPPLTLAAGWTILTATTNIQAADQWSAIVLTFAG